MGKRLRLSGALEFAAELLGHPVTLYGPIERGMQRGRTIGSPTANLAPSGFLVPPNGVDVARAFLPDGSYDARVNIGTRPTFESGDRIVSLAGRRVLPYYGLPPGECPAGGRWSMGGLRGAPCLVAEAGLQAGTPGGDRARARRRAQLVRSTGLRIRARAVSKSIVPSK